MLTYGRGISSIAEQLNKTPKEAQEIVDKFFNAFPKVKNWIDNTHINAKKNGYVEDWYGRRRQLPDIMLPEYIIEPLHNNSKFNPFLECEEKVDEKTMKKIKEYFNKLSKVKWRSEFTDIQQEGLKDGLEIKSNSIKIAEAERQSVNAIIQGGAATLTKLAMVNIDKDDELNRLGFRLLSTIHDEVFGECPEENAEECAKRLTEVMVNTAKPYMSVPMQCDPYVVKQWYNDEYTAIIQSEYNDLLKKENNITKVKEILYKEHCESTKEFIDKCLEKGE